jgi:16S rRNA U516 pseudouridylate synthase RsuA-like enzyme
MCEAVGLKVLRLKRVRIGGISLGELPLGQWRYLGENERFELDVKQNPRLSTRAPFDPKRNRR